MTGERLINYLLYDGSDTVYVTTRTKVYISVCLKDDTVGKAKQTRV